ncbi:MAG: DUF1385 domain-containing protein [Oscillospiraceae bacterium]|jgi:uncharacterized protein YqhQ|nr:DUF1385 domain-containing protein [Oscillospiraceae bacterium]
MPRENGASGDFRTSIGGQALIEGILMRGPKKQAIVVRTRDGLVTKVDSLKLLKDRYPIVGKPFIRGAVNFISSVSNGARALMFAADCVPADEGGEPSKFDRWLEKHIGAHRAEKALVALSAAIGVALSVGLFMLLPTFLAGFLGEVPGGAVVRNLIEGALRIAIFIAYLWLATRLREMRRVWEYHGAEHKTISCYEKGLELNVENVRVQSRLHPRCGTSFMFIVMIVSILVFSVARWSNIWMRVALRILLLPVVVAVSYEIIKWAGRRDNMATRCISAPGKALQRLTTREPDDSMIEVAIEAMRLVIPDSPGDDRW